MNQRKIAKGKLLCQCFYVGIIILIRPNCRPFVVVPIPGSNLILVVFDALECPVARMPSATYEKISIVPIEEMYNSNDSLACIRQTDPLPRRRPLKCINRHVNVSCGHSICILFFVINVSFVFVRRVSSINVVADFLHR